MSKGCAQYLKPPNVGPYVGFAYIEFLVELSCFITMGLLSVFFKLNMNVFKSVLN